MATGSPMVRRKRLGAELRTLRDRAGLTGEQVIERVGWASASKLSRIENGRTRPDLSDIFDLLDLYGVTGADREKLIAISRDAANTRGWWRSFADLGHRQRGYAELEAGVAELREYQQSLIPGLLQTPGYARTRVLSELPIRGRLDVAAEVAARQARQAVLTAEDPPLYHAIIDEAALRRHAAPADVMAAQLAQLVELSARPAVTLRVLPLDAQISDYYVPHSSFSLYRFADSEDPDIVVLETVTSDLHLGDDEDVSWYRLLFEWLAAAALPPEESVTFLAGLARQL
ncbi:MAG TPA: helix-turn-helix transcriptional regulator [Pseudonocardiaceae bacterium]